MGKQENIIETYFKDQCELNNILTFKFVSPSQRGVPDQIALYDGVTYYIELKAPGKTQSVQQKLVMKKIKNVGCKYYLIDSKEGVNEFIKEIIKKGVKK